MSQSLRPSLKLSGKPPVAAIHFLSDSICLASDEKTITVTVTRAGNFYDPRYGDFSITPLMLNEMVQNFNTNAYGQEIVLDVAHSPENGSAGFFKKLFVEGDKLKGVVDLTEYGIDSIKKRGFIYLSAEFHENFTDNEHKRKHGTVLLGAALTSRPVIKNLDKVQLSESSLDENRTYIDHDLAQTILSGETGMNWKILLAELVAQLNSFKLSEAIVKQLEDLAKKILSDVSEEAKAKIVLASISSVGKSLSEASTPDATLDLSALEALLSVKPKADPASAGDPDAEPVKALTADDVSKILSDALAAKDKDEKAKKDKLAANVKIFSDAVAAAEGLEESDVKSLSKAESLITVDMTSDQVTALANRELENANALIAARKLSGMGVSVTSPVGVIQLSQSSSSDSKQLEQIQHEALKKTRAYQNGELRLSTKVEGFVADTLALFDSINGPQINNAVRMLADGQTSISDTNLPVGYQREVIREALSDLNILMLVSTATDPAATATTQIPYEVRDVDHVVNNGVVFERQAIPRAGMTQAMDYAYINAMKISIDVSNEVMHFTRTSGINWDAWARNIAGAARLMRELFSSSYCEYDSAKF